MTIHLLHRLNTLERTLAADGLQSCACDGDRYVYGCGVFDPGEDFNLMLRYARAGKLLGTVGLSVDEDTLTHYTPEDRARLGHLLQHAMPVHTTDTLSAEWMQHYACTATVQGHPAWLAPDVLERTKNCVSRDGDNIEEWLADGWSGRVVARGKRDFFIANGDLGPAIAAALEGLPCILYIPSHHAGGRHDRLDRHILTRFAYQFNVGQCLARCEEELSQLLSLAVKEELPAVPPAQVTLETERARLTIQQMVLAKTYKKGTLLAVDSAIAACLGKPIDEGEEVSDTKNGFAAVTVAPGEGPRELVVDTVFDPEEHYDDCYFAEGKGLLYTRPDGTQDIYKGPSHNWTGFKIVAAILTGITPARLGRKYLSLGCGFGDDVLTFKQAGWDAYGIDLSKAAVDGAAPEVKDRVILGNVLDPEALADVGENFSTIVSFDFWEHIWEKDLDVLMDRVYELLAPGGVHFNVICTRGDAEQDHVYKPGVKFTKDNSWLLASGHVTICRWMWWLNRFRARGFQPDFQTAYLFQVARSENAGLRGASSWSTRNTVVVKKPRGERNGR